MFTDTWETLHDTDDEWKWFDEYELAEGFEPLGVVGGSGWGG